MGVEEKYNSVRSRLDAFGYKAPLGIDSIPLVERLFADLVHTTESLKKARMKPLPLHESQPTVTTSFEETVEPFRQDNSRLMSENNMLHKNIVSIKDKLVETSANYQQRGRKLQNENSDLRFLNTQYLMKIKQLEKEGYAKSEKLRKYQEASATAVVTETGKKSSTTRRQRITLDNTLPFSEFKATPIPAANDLYVADVLKIAEQRCNTLEGECSKLRDAKKEADDRLKYLRKQKELTETENERLRRQLSGGRPEAAITIDAAAKQSEKVISQLTLQLELAQEAQIEAEESAQSLNLEIESLRTKNDKLKAEVNEIGQMATALEQERQLAVAKADNNSTLVEKQTLERKIRGLEDELTEVSRKLGRESENSERLQRLLSDIEPGEDIVALRKERDFYQDAYRTISARNGGLGDEVVTPERVEAIVLERDAARKEVITLQRNYAEAAANVKVLQQERDRLELSFAESNNELASLRREVITKSPVKGRKSPGQSSDESILKRLQQERDRAMSELRKLECERDTLLEQVKINRENKIIDTVTLEQNVEDLENRARLLENERRELLMAQSDMKSKFEEAQADVYRLNTANEYLKAEAEKVRCDLDEVHLLRSQSDSTNREMMRVRSKLQSEFDAEVEKNNALEERMQVLVSSNTDLSHENSKLRNTVTTLDREKDALTIALDEKSERLVKLEKSAKTSEHSSGEQKTLIANLKQEIELLHDQIDDLERKMSQTRKQLDEKRSIENDLIASRENASREKRQLAEKVELLVGENEALTKELSIAVEQRDEFRSKVETDDEKINGIEVQLTHSRRELTVFNDKIAELEVTNLKLTTDLSTVISEYETMSRHLENTETEKTALSQKAIELENEIVEHLHASKVNEGNIGELSSNVRQLEEILAHKSEECTALQSALEGARELNAKLQSTSDNTTREIALHLEHITEKEAVSEDLRETIAGLKRQLGSAEDTVRTLEQTIRTIREQQYTSELQKSELEGDRDVQIEKAKIAAARSDAADEDRIELRSKLADADQEIESLKRQITDLKFQSEKTNQKLRRLQGQIQNQSV